MSNLDEVLHSAQQMVNEHRHAYPPVWHDDATRIIEQARAELAALRQERDEARAVVEAARYVVGETHGVNDDSVPDTFKAHLTVGDIRYLSAALERVKGTK